MAEDVKYRKVFEQLRKEIREGCYRYGEPLPSEEALVRKYKVSRITAVRAMDELVKCGLGMGGTLVVPSWFPSGGSTTTTTRKGSRSARFRR